MSDNKNPEVHECRCGHARDDHQSKSWQERGEKFYGQVCEHCPCKNYIEKGGFTDTMIESFKPMKGFQQNGRQAENDRISGAFKC